MAERAPLAGLVVVDFSALAPGPFATMLLGDLGADVITIEAPAVRRGGSTVTEIPLHGGRESRRLEINPLYRSRRSIVIDLKNPAGAAVAAKLIDGADILVEGFRPGVMDRLGFGYATVSERNPRLVYCSLTGYGQSGPLASKPGHDLNYLARAGLLAITARDGQKPAIPLNIVADFAAGGLVAAFAVLAAVHGRGQSGRGAHVDVSMFEGVLSMLAIAESWRRSGAPDPSYGLGLTSGGAPFYDCYATSDGRWVAVGCIEPKFFAALCEVLGLEHLVPLQFTAERWPEIRAAFAAAFAGRSLAEWEECLDGVDTAVSPVLELAEAFERAGIDDTLDVIVPRQTAEPERRYAARPGADTTDVLRHFGYGDAEIAALQDAGAVA
jgi:alpha-methylacyl-CoA racemase